ncbi:hypothetical protein N7533_009718 [Penicillium manginii]|uniref:uncharacterized protein n=1 Tax=Penicillium manginii TaxID=203109 RepID=UPI002549111A|nr:uncharacterized protein N7533_009718 [Penicillium manginii]KAJ5744848.1 hypothetical protein N7533_009718 [Penicillium manginii]
MTMRIPPYSPPKQGKKRAIEESPVLEAPGSTDPAVNESPPSQEEAQKAKANGGTEVKDKTLALDEKPVLEPPLSNDPAVSASSPPKKRVRTRAKKAKADGRIEKKGKTPALDENPAPEAPGSTEPAANASAPPKVKVKAKKTETNGGAAKRKKPWLDEAPQDHKVKLMRLAGKSSRLFFAGYQVAGTPKNPQISFDVIGSTGNLYKTTIKEVSSCDCPDSRFRGRNENCKHILYVLVRALKAPEELQYQRAFLPSEIRSMLEKASKSLRIDVPTVTPAEENGSTRKPIEGDCPICFTEMTTDEMIVWCITACGNNIHEECLKRWAAFSRDTGLRCVYCRSPWTTEKSPASGLDLEDLRSQKKTLGPNRYVNLAKEYGIVPSPKKGTGGEGAGGRKKVPESSQ